MLRTWAGFDPVNRHYGPNPGIPADRLTPPKTRASVAQDGPISTRRKGTGAGFWRGEAVRRRSSAKTSPCSRNAWPCWVNAVAYDNGREFARATFTVVTTSRGPAIIQCNTDAVFAVGTLTAIRR